MTQESKPLRKVNEAHIHRTIHYLHAMQHGVSMDRIFRVLRALQFKVDGDAALQVKQLVVDFVRRNDFVKLLPEDGMKHLTTFTDETVFTTIRYLFFMRKVVDKNLVIAVLQPQTYDKGSRVNMNDAKVPQRLRAYMREHEESVGIRNAPDGVHDEFYLKEGIVAAIVEQSKECVEPTYQRRAKDLAVPNVRRETNKRREYVAIADIVERIDKLADVGALVDKYPGDTWVLSFKQERHRKLLLINGSVKDYRAKREYAYEFQVAFEDVRLCRLSSLQGLVTA